MRNPFKDQRVDKYAIKTNYNRIRSRGNSVQSNKSNGSREEQYKQNRFQQIRIGLEYRSNLAQKKQLEKEALKIYGPESLRFQPSYFQKMEKIKTENINYFDMGQSVPFFKKKITSSQPRDSDTISTLVNFGNQNGFVNANSYQSNGLIVDSRSRRSLSINSAHNSATQFQNQRTDKKKISIYHRLKHGQDFCPTSDDQETQEPSAKRFQSNANRFQNNLGYNTINQDTYESKSSKHMIPSSKNLASSQKTLTTSYKALNSVKSIKSTSRKSQNRMTQQMLTRKSPQRIKVKGKQFYASPYYQI